VNYPSQSRIININSCGLDERFERIGYAAMTSDVIYSYKKTRRQRSWLFINMAVACLLYIAGLYGYEHYANTRVAEDFRVIYVAAFSVASLVLFAVAGWLRTHPATYEAVITSERFIVNYPNSTIWSFDIAVSDIKRFEYRNTLSHAGKGIARSGVLLNDGNFHEICMNYGNNIKDMYKAVRTVKTDVTFPTKVNQNVQGLLSKDYDD